MSQTAEILPKWNLGDLYAGPDDPALKRDMAAVAERAAAFHAQYEGKIGSLSAADLTAALKTYEALEDLVGRILSYVQLLYAQDMSDAAITGFYQTTQEQITEATTKLIFFTLELNALNEDHLQQLLSDAALAHYRPWITDQRVMRPHQLSKDMEALLHEKQVAGRAAWIRLFDETMAGLKFHVAGIGDDTEERGLEATLDLLSDPDRKRRQAAAAALSKTFADNLKLFAHITNTLAKDKEIEDRWRGFAVPEQRRHLANLVEPEVVDALQGAVEAAYPAISHRYYRLKAQWLGLEKLEYWDRNAPLPQDDNRQISWSEATDTVLGAYRAFSPRLADIGGRFFQDNWIDAQMRAGKAPGAFSHPTVPSAHPYILMNYQGKTRDVMTLAHELGHGVHQVLAAKQGALMADTPLTLAETASVFGEQLTFRALLDQETDPARRRIMLAGKVEDMINTVVRQISFYAFECRVHRARRDGELSAEALGEIWLDVQGQSLGPAIHLPREYANFWCYIPHFIHSPFYVYAYAFGDCLVNALYANYQNASAGFVERYLEMLAAGGSLRHYELLAPFGLDARAPDFWQQGLNVIAGFIDELEALSSQT